MDYRSYLDVVTLGIQREINGTSAERTTSILHLLAPGSLVLIAFFTKSHIPLSNTTR
jgi:hypothetical protein